VAATLYRPGNIIASTGSKRPPRGSAGVAEKVTVVKIFTVYDPNYSSVPVV
jgi:hypothetical protein